MTTYAFGPSVPSSPVFRDPRDVLYTRFLGPLAADKYALTMASALFEAEAQNGENSLFAADATFQMFFRRLPKNGMKEADGTPSRSAYLLTAGLPFLASWLEGWQFSPGDIATLARQKDAQGARLFSDRFLNTLEQSRLSLSIEAMPDGTLAFPREPMLRIRGPFWQCLMVEKTVLSLMNACSNKATLTAQAVEAAAGRPVWEYGGRRDSEPSGLLTAYSAFVGGATGSSNMLADKFFAIPSGGTMAHALVMVAEDELSAFRLWARGAPGLGIFLVDTYDTLEGVRNAIRACKAEGVPLQGIRLDSGNLAALSGSARVLLDEAGFAGAKIFASNDLNPEKLQQLADAGAPIDAFGVGTWIASAEANPALGGVYKLAQVRRRGAIRDVMKFSEEAGKATLPGVQEVLRFLRDDGRYDGDVLLNPAVVPDGDVLMAPLRSFNPQNPLDVRMFNAGARFVRPLQPFLRDGQLAQPLPSAHDARSRAAAELARLDRAHKRLVSPRPYSAGVEESLHQSWREALARNSQPQFATV